MGIQADKAATIDFAPVAQPRLSGMAKRWYRWQLSAGLSASHAAAGIRAVRRFSAFLARHDAGGTSPASVGRPLLERYLADLASSGLSPSSRLQHVSALNELFRDARPHGWDNGTLPAGAVFYPEDFPKIGRRLPRAVDDFPIELRRGEDVLVARSHSRLNLIADVLCLHYRGTARRV